MPRKVYSQQTQRQDPADSHGVPTRGGDGAADDHAPPDTWLNDPRHVQAFFEAIERARKAKTRERSS